MKKFTKRWIKKWQPCKEAVDWFYKQEERGVIPVLQKLMAEGKYNWANWAITRCMKREQYLRYAIYAAKSVLHIFEGKYPDNDRPREAIKAAEKCLKKDAKGNRNAAYAAAHAAHAAADAAHVKKGLQIKILKYGLKLLRRYQ